MYHLSLLLLKKDQLRPLTFTKGIHLQDHTTLSYCMTPEQCVEVTIPWHLSLCFTDDEFVCS